MMHNEADVPHGYRQRALKAVRTGCIGNHDRDAASVKRSVHPRLVVLVLSPSSRDARGASFVND
jgi:hypothetical protein